MSEEELLKKYACNSLASFIDGYLTCEVAYDLLKSQFKEIERLKELLVKIYGLTFDIDSNIMKQKYALANGFNFEIKDMTREFYFEREDKLQELKGSDKE